jgi:hypothetical protein
MSDQTYTRWFVDYPSTHVRAGQTVEVTPVARVAEIEAEAERLRARLRTIVTEWQLRCAALANEEKP